MEENQEASCPNAGSPSVDRSSPLAPFRSRAGCVQDCFFSYRQKVMARASSHTVCTTALRAYLPTWQDVSIGSGLRCHRSQGQTRKGRRRDSRVKQEEACLVCLRPRARRRGSPSFMLKTETILDRSRPPGNATHRDMFPRARPPTDEAVFSDPRFGYIVLCYQYDAQRLVARSPMTTSVFLGGFFFSAATASMSSGVSTPGENCLVFSRQYRPSALSLAHLYYLTPATRLRANCSLPYSFYLRSATGRQLSFILQESTRRRKKKPTGRKQEPVNAPAVTTRLDSTQSVVVQPSQTL